MSSGSEVSITTQKSSLAGGGPSSGRPTSGGPGGGRGGGRFAGLRKSQMSGSQHVESNAADTKLTLIPAESTNATTAEKGDVRNITIDGYGGIDQRELFAIELEDGQRHRAVHGYPDQKEGVVVAGDEDNKHQPRSQEEEEYSVPHLTLWQTFRLFLSFGFRAWGGAIPQIALLKDELVIQQRWISVSHFNKVYAVYQVLPGPEAAELCCYFGQLATRERAGGIVGGVAFLLPGFVLIMLFSWLYGVIGNGNVYFNASFRALQPLVAAMVLRAVHKIAEDAFYEHGHEDGNDEKGKQKKFNPYLFIIAILSALNSALRINFFATLLIYGVAFAVYAKTSAPSHRDDIVDTKNPAAKPRSRSLFNHIFFPGWAGFLIVILQYVGYILYVSFRGFPSEFSLSVGVAPTPTPLTIWALGLLAGLLSFGGAYTTIPFILQEAVLRGGWIARQTFLDGVALANALPAPTVIFSTFVGFVGGKAGAGGSPDGQGGNVWYGVLGGVLMTIGMFTAPFLFAVVGHSVLDKITHMQSVAAFFAGITASVVGLIAVTALDILRGAVTSPIDTDARLVNNTDTQLHAINSRNATSSVVFGITLYILYHYRFPNKSLVLVI
ncbi:hypothetical protein HK102_000848, partial [Quaeritorhiza haematococci]